MKRCPKCRRDYTDGTLNFCLDDGATLVDGPASVDESATAILSVPPAVAGGFLAGESPAQPQILTTDRTAIFNRGAKKELSDKSDGRWKLLMGLGALVVLLTAGFLAYRYITPTAQIDSIAVMPFVNESGNADVEYLSDGMTETLISSLSQVPNLNVKARSSVFRYKGKETNANTIGRELNVQAILTGRVVQRGQDLILNVELIDVQTENILWTENYSRQLANLVSLQSEIARDVSQKLKTKLSGADMQKMTKSYTANPDALQLYLRGRFYWNKRTRKDVEKSIEYFQQAIAIDQNYALAYTGLADAFALPEGGLSRERVPKARDAALKALALDSDLPEAHAALGHILTRYDLDFAGAERELRRAIELNPNYVYAHHRYSELLSFLERHDESSAEIKRALELEPFCLVCNSAYAQSMIFARKYDAAIAQAHKTLELDATFIQAHRSLAWAYWMTGNYAASVEERAKAQEINGNNEAAARMRESFAKGGWEGFLRSHTGDQRLSDLSYNLACFFAALGEKDRAFAELNKSFENRDYFISAIKVDPRLDPLRDDPRFQELLKKVGFPE